MKVLVVDDDHDVRDSTKLLLETLGHEVEVCGDIKNIPETAERFHPDLVLHDLHMPGLVVPDYFAGLQASPLAGVPIILFSATLRGGEGKSIPGVSAVLAKPFRIPELEAILKRSYK